MSLSENYSCPGSVIKISVLLILLCFIINITKLLGTLVCEWLTFTLKCFIANISER